MFKNIISPVSDIYSKYYVLVEKEFTYVDAETSTPDDWVFKTDKIRTDFYCDCSKLLDYIMNLINDEYFSDVRFKDDKIVINTFNPLTGEGGCVKIYIQRVMNDGTDDSEN